MTEDGAEMEGRTLTTWECIRELAKMRHEVEHNLQYSMDQLLKGASVSPSGNDSFYKTQVDESHHRLAAIDKLAALLLKGA